MEHVFNAKLATTWIREYVSAAEATALHARTNQNVIRAKKDTSIITKPTHAIPVV